jgi:ABC-2 type transport system ATP-binding protein
MQPQAAAPPDAAQSVDEPAGIAILAQGLTRRFGNVTAVEDITLAVPRGTVFGFLGPNGAGKTTTIRLLLGLLPPTDGTLRVLGRTLPSDGLAVRRRTGVVLEQHGLYEGMTVGASLEFAARAFGLSRPEAAVRVAELGERFGLADRLSARPQTLSRGMRQRMSIARALVGSPELLVLDEPTNGLDAQAAADLRALLVELVAQGTTVFLTTHLLAEAERLCDEVTVIKSGRLVATGTPSDLRREATVHRVRIEGPGVAAVLAGAPAWRSGSWSAEGADAVVVEVDNLASVPGVVAAVVGLGAAIHRVEPVGQTLEAAFLSLVGDAPDAAVAPSGTVAP